MTDASFPSSSREGAALRIVNIRTEQSGAAIFLDTQGVAYLVQPGAEAQLPAWLQARLAQRLATSAPAWPSDDNRDNLLTNSQSFTYPNSDFDRE